MARLRRFVAAGFPHHVTQRGNRRQTIFFEPADYAVYRDLLAERCHKASVEVWAYCLMPNHVHLVLTPSTPDGLARAIGETHRQYTGFVNARARWTGHLFQGRFSSVALDEAHLVAAARYVALNPVRARLVACAQDWAWSSARAHLAGRDDALVRVAPLLDRVGRFDDLIEGETDRLAFAALRAAESTGRALGSNDFVATLERVTGRRLQPKRPGRKPSAGIGIEQLDLRMPGMSREK
jgi:putative transposase